MFYDRLNKILALTIKVDVNGTLLFMCIFKKRKMPVMTWGWTIIGLIFTCSDSYLAIYRRLRPTLIIMFLTNSIKVKLVLKMMYTSSYSSERNGSNSAITSRIASGVEIDIFVEMFWKQALCSSLSSLMFRLKSSWIVETVDRRDGGCIEEQINEFAWNSKISKLK